MRQGLREIVNNFPVNFSQLRILHQTGPSKGEEDILKMGGEDNLLPQHIQSRYGL